MKRVLIFALFYILMPACITSCGFFAPPVQQDLTRVKADWQTLQQAVANNSSGEPASAYSSSDVQKAMNQANGALSTIHTTLTNAQGQAATYDQESAALVIQATTLSNNMGC